MKKVTEFLNWIVSAHLGRIVGGVILCFVGWVLTPDYGSLGFLTESWAFNPMYYIGVFGATVVVVYSLILIVYAWIINPLNNRKTK